MRVFPPSQVCVQADLAHTLHLLAISKELRLTPFNTAQMQMRTYTHTRIRARARPHTHHTHTHTHTQHTHTLTHTYTHAHFLLFLQVSPNRRRTSGTSRGNIMVPVKHTVDIHFFNPSSSPSSSQLSSAGVLPGVCIFACQRLRVYMYVRAHFGNPKCAVWVWARFCLSTRSD